MASPTAIPYGNLSYTNPISSLRTGGDRTTIKAFNDIPMQDRVTRQAQGIAQTMQGTALGKAMPLFTRLGATQDQAYKAMFGTADERASLSTDFGRQVDRENLAGMQTGGWTQANYRDPNSWDSKFRSSGAGYQYGTTVNPFTGRQDSWARPTGYGSSAAAASRSLWG